MVIMGNTDACQMVEIGTLRIKMFDGVVRNLTDVRYIPYMTKNIISVGVVESKGLKILWRMVFSRSRRGTWL